jgi:hypothetical protein
MDAAKSEIAARFLHRVESGLAATLVVPCRATMLGPGYGASSMLPAS